MHLRLTSIRSAGLLLLVLFLAAGLGLRLGFRPWAPRVVRMLPAGETLAYLNLEPLRAAGWPGGADLGLERAPAYAAFVRESGFDFERDLNALALSLEGPPAQPEQTTCVIEGRFTPQFQAYLQAHAQRHLRLAGTAAYQFPGWARPQQPMLIVPIDSHHVLLTNAVAPEAVVERARRWLPQAPALWQAGFWSPQPIGYVAVDAMRLAAARQLDGSSPPWRGARQVTVRLQAGLASGLMLKGEEQMLDPGDADGTRAWTEAEISTLRPLFAADPSGKPTLRALLDQIKLRQEGDRVSFDLRLDAATLRKWRQATDPD